jgi:hypothetical protein
MSINYNSSKSNTGNVALLPHVTFGSPHPDPPGTVYVSAADLAALKEQAPGEIASVAPVQVFKVVLKSGGEFYQKVQDLGRGHPVGRRQY